VHVHHRHLCMYACVCVYVCVRMRVCVCVRVCIDVGFIPLNTECLGLLFYYRRGFYP
jgi:hypothetical protein